MHARKAFFVRSRRLCDNELYNSAHALQSAPLFGYFIILSRGMQFRSQGRMLVLRKEMLDTRPARNVLVAHFIFLALSKSSWKFELDTFTETRSWPTQIAERSDRDTLDPTPNGTAPLDAPSEMLASPTPTAQCLQNLLEAGAQPLWRSANFRKHKHFSLEARLFKEHLGTLKGGSGRRPRPAYRL